jgi:hypothetical protein
MDSNALHEIRRVMENSAEDIYDEGQLADYIVEQ